MNAATDTRAAALAELADLNTQIALVTGSRDESEELRAWVRACLIATLPESVVVGDCPTGVDAYTREWCTELWGKPGELWHVHDADWKRFGVRAGPRRNGEMVYRVCLQAMRGKRVTCLAFPRPGSRGTIDCMRQATNSGLTVKKL